MLFDFDDILIEPEIHTSIRSRKKIDPLDEKRMLPLFTAPMDTVISEENSGIFSKNKIYSIIPRKKEVDPSYFSTDHKVWFSYSLDDFKKVFIDNKISVEPGKNIYALIDVANGHMDIVKDLVKESKEIYGRTLVLMVGNCANPMTFLSLAQAGADYVRMGIGNGGGCLTTEQTGIGYPMASLIHETHKIQSERSLYNTKIVADGGFKKYSDVIKALALGADYVMLGSIFNKALESCAPTYRDWTNGDLVDQYDLSVKIDFNSGESKFVKNFRGMSTKEVQETLGNKELKTSEGISKTNVVMYTLAGWTENFIDYLKSAMSYTDCITIGEFIGGVRFNKITQNSLNRYKK
jgi:hypothetical protein